MSAKMFITAEEVEKMSEDDFFSELVKGELVQMSPPGLLHGIIASKIDSILRNYVTSHDLGLVCVGDVGFILSRKPDTVRAPDVAFISKERLPSEIPVGFFEGAPDLAVEVVSPSDTSEEIEAKVIDYLKSGVRMIWVVYPKNQTVAVYTSLLDVKVLTKADTLTGGEVLAGFSCGVAQIFD